GCGGRGVGDGGAWHGMAAVVDGDNDDDFIKMMVRVAIMKCGVVCRGGVGRRRRRKMSKMLSFTDLLDSVFDLVSSFSEQVFCMKTKSTFN
nr:hypothetical protein [Tanacetum cinerariifolium]